MTNPNVALVAAWIASSLALASPKAKPAMVNDVAHAAVMYRGRTHVLKGADAEKLAKVGLQLLGASRLEIDLASDPEAQPRFTAMQGRSSVSLHFTKPLVISIAGVRTAPVNVETLVIPFSPDLDPETVYVLLPGKPLRAFSRFPIQDCDVLRKMLIHAIIYPMVRGAVVQGRVQAIGKPPAPRVWEVDPAIQRAFGLTRYTEEIWLVGPEGGLRNCVVILRDKDQDRRLQPRPMAPASIGKDMVRYEPRVLVVTPDTPVVLQNTDSPCTGYWIRGNDPTANEPRKLTIEPGEARTVALTRPDLYSITCPTRTYARGYIHVVDTPYFAITDANGRFTLRGLPAGDYEVAVWHEAAGQLPRESGPLAISINTQPACFLEYKVSIPKRDRQ